MLKRKILDNLLAWKAQKNKKPLIVRGARQVGKTTTVKQLGSYYASFVYLNIEKASDATFFINYGDDVHGIIAAIELNYNVSLTKGDALIFIDEIQEVPKAIQLLRYFYEELPNIDIIAAGSLLEFALGEVDSFPVGRVEQIPIYPLDFEEFLWALQEQQAWQVYNIIPVPNYAHEKLLQLFHEYILIGGMPEVVVQYIQNNKQISTLQKTYSSIWDNYLNDVEKYGRNTNEKKIINHIMHTASLVRDRITFHGFGASSYSSREVSEAFQKLQKAGLFTLIYPTTDVAAPLTPNIKRKPKLQFLDTGLLNYAGNLHQELLQVKDFNALYKGYIVNHIAFQEIISTSTRIHATPLFWTREVTTANAEVDIIIPYHRLAIPVEVKAGAKGSLKSLHEYMERSNHTYAIRLLANTFSIEQSTTRSGKVFTIMNLPYYLAGKLMEWIAYLVELERN
jgi:uncharacterized protein